MVPRLKKSSYIDNIGSSRTVWMDGPRFAMNSEEGPEEAETSGAPSLEALKATKISLKRRFTADRRSLIVNLRDGLISERGEIEAVLFKLRKNADEIVAILQKLADGSPKNKKSKYVDEFEETLGAICGYCRRSNRILPSPSDYILARIFSVIV